ncbi:hypothetical protein EPI10_022810 [Gossypium australe]|uniref:Uncharacterized protein n=1 Tax=Gossypium australe TaxID=47621 RepID=A0A5B6VT44_9ROSI|nr:hypothetical protein EPI10_022810 [Gossypium australe]
MPNTPVWPIIGARHSRRFGTSASCPSGLAPQWVGPTDDNTGLTPVIWYHTMGWPHHWIRDFGHQSPVVWHHTYGYRDFGSPVVWHHQWFGTTRGRKGVWMARIGCITCIAMNGVC